MLFSSSHLKTIHKWIIITFLVLLVSLLPLLYFLAIYRKTKNKKLERVGTFPQAFLLVHYIHNLELSLISRVVWFSWIVWFTWFVRFTRFIWLAWFFRFTRLVWFPWFVWLAWLTRFFWFICPNDCIR